MDLSVKWGRDPLWASSLDPDDLEALMAYELVQVERARRAKFAADMAALKKLGGSLGS